MKPLTTFVVPLLMYGAVFASPAAAQTLTRVGIPPAGLQGAPLTHRGIVTINPFAVIFGGFSGDIELAITPGFTTAVGGTYFGSGDDDFDWKSMDLTFRYYPAERAPKGFSVGISGGFIDLEDDQVGGPSGPVTAENSGPTIGFIGGYNWLLGRSERLAIAVGLGAKRLFIEDEGSNPPDAWITGRLGIGLSF
jgi:hypothetical protein